MSNYPDNFRGTNMDAGRCSRCGRREYTDENGVCEECVIRKPLPNKALRGTFMPGMTAIITSEGEL